MLLSFKRRRMVCHPYVLRIPTQWRCLAVQGIDSPLHPGKENMEPKNHPFLNRKLLFQTSTFRFHVSFPGCTFFSFQQSLHHSYSGMLQISSINRVLVSNPPPIHLWLQPKQIQMVPCMKGRRNQWTTPEQHAESAATKHNLQHTVS